MGWFIGLVDKLVHLKTSFPVTSKHVRKLRSVADVIGAAFIVAWVFFASRNRGEPDDHTHRPDKWEAGWGGGVLMTCMAEVV